MTEEERTEARRLIKQIEDRHWSGDVLTLSAAEIDNVLLTVESDLLMARGLIERGTPMQIKNECGSGPMYAEKVEDLEAKLAESEALLKDAHIIIAGMFRDLPGLARLRWNETEAGRIAARVTAEEIGKILESMRATHAKCRGYETGS